MLSKGAHIVDTLCHIGDQCMWGLWNLYFMIRGEGHTPLMVDILFLLVDYILCRFIVWSEEWQLISVRSFPFMEAHVLKVEALGSVWVTVIWWFSLISLVSMDTPVCIMTAFGYLIVCLWLKTSYIIPIQRATVGLSSPRTVCHSPRVACLAFKVTLGVRVLIWQTVRVETGRIVVGR